MKLFKSFLGYLLNSWDLTKVLQTLKKGQFSLSLKEWKLQQSQTKTDTCGKRDTREVLHCKWWLFYLTFWPPSWELSCCTYQPGVAAAAQKLHLNFGWIRHLIASSSSLLCKCHFFLRFTVKCGVDFHLYKFMISGMLQQFFRFLTFQILPKRLRRRDWAAEIWSKNAPSGWTFSYINWNHWINWYSIVSSTETKKVFFKDYTYTFHCFPHI